MYKNIRYMALGKQKMPFIFAYSGFLPKEKIEATKKAKFDGCFELIT